MEDPTRRRLQRKGERCRGGGCGVWEYTLLELLERKQGCRGGRNLLGRKLGENDASDVWCTSN